MGKAIVVKLAFVAALAAAVFVSSQLRFDISALDLRQAETNAARRDRGLETDRKMALADADLLQTHARPLFSQDRRPFVARPPVVEQPEQIVVAAVAEQPGSLPRRLALIGTNAGISATSVLVRNQESAEVRWLAVGESFDGWTLASASADSASFTCGERQAEDCDYRLTLYAEARSE